MNTPGTASIAVPGVLYKYKKCIYICHGSVKSLIFVIHLHYSCMMNDNHILIVEDDLTFAMMLRTWLAKKGFHVDTVSRVSDAVKLLSGDDGGTVGLVLSDMRLPDRDGIFLLQWLRKWNRAVPFIMMTSYAEVQNAVLAMKSGASDYIAKPVQPDVLLQKINDALAGGGCDVAVAAHERPVMPKQGKTVVPAEDTDSSASSGSAAPPRYLRGTSEAARQLYGYVDLVAPTPMSVLILGASGTGKEYVARSIHVQSRRAGRPFVAMDCGAIPRDVAASEFFGHVKGAFTGAVADKRGAFVEADGGTLFLDEVGNLSYDVQVQLLRAIQEHRVRPVGSAREVEVDFRLVCATNENLAEAVARGTFREDLYHRINEFSIVMPELKDRGADLFLFADLFLRQANHELDRDIVGFDAKASEMIASYSWPGNLRELKNVVKRAVLLARSGYITAADLAPSLSPAGILHILPLRDDGDEKSRIVAALRSTGGNKSRAAQLLGIDRKTLYNKIEKYGITQ